MIEQQGRGQPQARRGGQAVAQLDGHQRVEAQYAEGSLGVDGVRRGVSEDLRGLFPDQVQQGPLLLGGRQCADAVAQRGVVLARAVGGGEGAARLGEVGEEGAGADGGQGGGIRRPVHVGHRQVRRALGQSLAEGGEGGGRGHEDQPVAARPVGQVRVRRHAEVRPGAPGHRGGRQPLPAPVFGEGVEEGVGCGVVGLAGLAHGARDRGEHHEHLQVEVPGELVQVQGGGGLGAQYGLEAFGGERFQHARVQDTGGVHDAVQGQVRRDVREDGRQGVAVGGVAGGHGDPDAPRGELGRELLGTGGLRAAAAGEYQVLRPGVGEPERDLAAESAGASGDHDRAVRGPVGAGVAAGRDACQAAGEGPGGPDRDLVLVRGEHPQERGDGPCVQGLGEVDEPAPQLRGLQRDHASEAPRVRLHGVGEHVAVVDGHGAAGHAPQRGPDAGGLQCAQQGGDRGQAARHGGQAGVRPFVEGQQGEYAVDGAVGPDDGLALPVGFGQYEQFGAQALVAQGVEEPGGPRVGGGVLGQRDEPVPGGGEAGGGGDGGPVRPVAPAVRHRLRPALLSP
ncbi:hypothetical protein GCM10009544_04190 [Streptomyces stramineus]|uniref:Uncharacterized protein n=1 Tax=Streptomyces stramineus TaxID=173861 RepID=A0ABN0ZE92_9ACTN